MAQIAVVPMVFNMTDPESDPKALLLNDRGYTRKNLIMLCDSNEEQIKEYLNDTFIPAVNQMGKFKENTGPECAKEDFLRVVETWSEILMDDQVTALFKWGFVNGDDKCFSTVDDFLKYDPGHLYSGWKEGEVPLSVISEHSLLVEHLRPGDATRIVFSAASEQE